MNFESKTRKLPNLCKFTALKQLLNRVFKCCTNPKLSLQCMGFILIKIRQLNSDRFIGMVVRRCSKSTCEYYSELTNVRIED